MTHQAEGSQRTPEFDLDAFDEVIRMMAGTADGLRVHKFREPIRKLLAERDALRSENVIVHSWKSRCELAESELAGLREQLAAMKATHALSKSDWHKGYEDACNMILSDKAPPFDLIWNRAAIAADPQRCRLLPRPADERGNDMTTTKIPAADDGMAAMYAQRDLRDTHSNYCCCDFCITFDILIAPQLGKREWDKECAKGRQP